MTGSEFNRSIQPGTTKNAAHAQFEKADADKAKKIEQLKNQVAAGTYKVDTQRLAQRIQGSGVLNNE